MFFINCTIQTDCGSHSWLAGDLQFGLNGFGALKIAETFGYTRFFEDSPQLERLLQQTAGRNIHAQYSRQQFLASFRSMHGIRKNGGMVRKEKEHSQLVDPLSERELEVPGLLATGLPPAAVAKKLFLSPFTLKAHTQNIYTKLGVHSCIEAINRARELDLL